MGSGSEGMGLGVEEMDGEHDLLLGVVHALERAVDAAPRAQVEELLQQLSELSRVHFATEEILMRLHAYPEFAAHQLEHAHLVEQIEQVRAEFAKGHVQPTRSFASALHHWFSEHIRNHDVALSRYVQASGSPSP
jgi:hemerythrin